VAGAERLLFPLEWLALITAIGISIWCMAKPLGGPKYELREPTHLLGAFVSRTSWGLALFGGILTTGGVAGAMAAIYDVSTGRATVGEVVKDIGIFIEGWIAGLIAPAYDAELEKTHAYALFLLLIPGLLTVWYNVIPFFKRGNEFQVHPDGSVSVRRGDSWEPLMEYQYSTVTADGTMIDCTPPADGPLQLCCRSIGFSPASTGCACPTRSAPSSSGDFLPGAGSTSSRRRTGTASPRVESNWERVGSAQRRDALAGDPSLRARGEAKIRQSVKQDAQRRGQFGEREPVSDAAVRALAETDKGRGSAGDVECVGLGIDRGIAVGCVDRKEHRRLCGDVDAMPDDRFGADAWQHADRRLPTEALPDRPRQVLVEIRAQ